MLDTRPLKFLRYGIVCLSACPTGHGGWDALGNNRQELVCAGREFECDFGYVGEDGICVVYKAVPEACGGAHEPVCTNLAGVNTLCVAAASASADVCADSRCNR